MKIHLVFHMFLLEPYKTMNILERRQIPPHLIEVDNNQELKVKEVLDLRQY